MWMLMKWPASQWGSRLESVNTYNKIWFQNCFFNSDFVFEMYEWYWYLKLWVLKSCKFYTKEIQSLPLSFFPNNIISSQSFDSARCKETAHDMRHMELNANSGINECHFHPTKSTILLWSLGPSLKVLRPTVSRESFWNHSIKIWSDIKSTFILSHSSIAFLFAFSTKKWLPKKHK